MTTSASGSGATAQGDPVFVLAGGVSLGAVRVGMLSLLEGNVTPDAIVGTSIGALNG
jgi:predicted acylesterase/phospholipase RssA